MIFTTLELCKENKACSSGYKTLIKSLPKGHSKTEPIALTHIIESNGLQDAIWALRATTEPCRDFITSYALWCAEQVLDIYEKEYPNDKRVRECLEGIRKYQAGKISKKDLLILRNAAYDAYDADTAAYAAYAAYAAAGVVAYAAADAAAYAAADAAAYAAADDTYATRDKQKAKLIEMLGAHK